MDIEIKYNATATEKEFLDAIYFRLLKSDQINSNNEIDIIFLPDTLQYLENPDLEKELASHIAKFIQIGILGERLVRGNEMNKASLIPNEFFEYYDRVYSHNLKVDPRKHKLDFDDVHGILSFAGESFSISKHADSDAHELLRTIFKDRSRLWHNDDVLDDWKFSDNKKLIPKNKVYQAGKAVNRIVAQNTKIKDFLILTTKTVALNKKYLET